jgi:hypothetical protein
MSEELKERIRAFSALNLIRCFRHVTPVENRFFEELRVNRVPIALPGNRRTPRRQLMHDIRHFHHTRLRHARTLHRTYAQYASMEEIRRWHRVPTALLREVKSFDRSRLKPLNRELERSQYHVLPRLPVQSGSARWPEYSPVSHMPWWNDLSLAIHSQPVRRLRHVQLPSTAVFKPVSAAAVQEPIVVLPVVKPIVVKPIVVLETMPVVKRTSTKTITVVKRMPAETVPVEKRMPTETVTVEKRIMPVMQKTRPTSSFGKSNDTGLPA